MTDLVWTPASDDDPEFAVTSASQHSALAGRSAAGAHPATAVTYDNTSSGLTADTVQEAIDEVASGGGGAVDSVNGETGVVVLDAADVGAVPVTAVGLLAGERNRGDWDNATAYVVGDVVHDHDGDGQVYVATAPNTGEQPSLNLGSWDVVDPTGRLIHLGPGATSGYYGAAVGPGATSGGYGTAVGPFATSGGYGTAVGPFATSGDGGTAVGTGATSGGYGTAVGPGATSGGYGTAVGVSATSGDYGVNIANIYTGTIDPGDPTTPLTATIATGHIDLPETAAVTNPAADHLRLIARTDGLYVRDETGTEVGPLGAGGGAGGIPETIIDAAGDLIVGTAADTAGRLALGAAGQVLTSNGTAPTWAPPPMASIGYVSGGIYGLGGNSASVNYHPASAAGRWVAHPVWLPAGNYSGLSVLSTVAAVATWRLGIYNGTPDGATTLLHDCGTIDTNATPGSLLASSAFTVPTTGLYWLALLVDAYTAAPTVWSFRGHVADIPALPYLGHRFPTATTTRVYFTRSASGVATGAMPATAPTQALNDQSPLIRAHAA